MPHVPPAEHPAFFSSSGLSLNVTRGSMVRWGFCPSGRLFEAAACGVAQITDSWEGLDAFFEPGEELLVARSASDVVAAMALPGPERERIGRAARRRVLAAHTAARRARELAILLGGGRGESAASPPAPRPRSEGAA